jgi:superfamily II DNA or RNA helicase
MSKIYDKIVKKRGFRELAYQKDFLTNPIYENPKNPLVLAAGTSSGKSFMSIMHEEIFYSNPANKNKRTLYIPSSRTVLRDNTAKELEDFNPSFTYCVATNKAELLQAIKNKCNVVVALPQTLIGSMDILPKFHNFILDEAHQWYFKSTIQNIIKKISPKYQLLLTGTPSRFIAKGDKFTFKFVPVMDLYDLKQVTNVKLEVVSSSYDFKQSDYLSAYGNLKSNVRMSDKQSDNALMVVCREMIKKLKNPIKGLHNVNRLSKNLFSIFGELDKTIIYCHSLKQADAFYNSLDSFKGLKGKVLISHSENDKDSVLFEQFRNDSDIKVLVAVDRGRLGYNMPELFNVVDFTMTQSLDMLLQMYGRLLRLSKTKKQKIYYKVATKNTAPYFVDLMTAMLCLTNMEWYSKFNGKNMGGILIPKVLNNTKKKTKSKSSTSKSKSTKPFLSLADLDIPLDLNLFKQSALHTNDDGFATIAWTTLDDVRREFYGMKNFTLWNNETAIKEAQKYSSIAELRSNSNGVYKYIKKHNLQEKAFKHFNIKYKTNKVFLWNDKSVIEEAKKYDVKDTFRLSCSGAYKYILRHKLQDKAFNHFKTNIPAHQRYSLEDALKICKKNNCKNSSEFRKKYKDIDNVLRYYNYNWLGKIRKPKK